MKVKTATLRPITPAKYSPQLVLEMECGCVDYCTRPGGWSLEEPPPDEWPCVNGHEPQSLAEVPKGKPDAA